MLTFEQMNNQKGSTYTRTRHRHANITLPLTYEDVFLKALDQIPLDFISKYSKVGLLKELSFLKEKIDDYNSKLNRYSINDYSEFLGLFVIPNEIKQRIISIQTSKDGASYTIFTRDTILWAFELILNSKFESNIIDINADEEFRENIFLFLLSINSKFLETDITKGSSFEEINASLIPANSFPENELILTPYKGLKLFEYFSNSEKYCELINVYIQSKYNVSVRSFYRCILRWGNGNGYIIKIQNTDNEYSIFKEISDSSIENNNIKTLLTIKRSPIYQCTANEFLVLDKSFLLGKIYNQFIYDFWFDWINSQTKIPIETYFGDIGHFFENFTSNITKNIFSFLEHPVPLSLNELMYKSSKGQKEICDFYARHNRKIIIGEFKLGNIDDYRRFSGEPEILKKRSDFFKSADQLSNTINNLSIIKDKFDNKIQLNKSLQIFPVCVFNDSLYDFPTMSVIFDNYWNKIKPQIKNVHINPLTIIHIDQLELLNSFLNTKVKKKQIWDILKKHCRKTGKIRSFGTSLISGYKLDYDNSTIEKLQLMLDE